MQNAPEYLLALVACIQSIHSKGWSEATSTNYSHRCQKNPEHMYISRSGVDKAFFGTQDFLLSSIYGVLQATFAKEKASAESAIHQYIYQHSPDTQCIVHSHSAVATVLSKKYWDLGKTELHITGYEMQKAFSGQNTHQAEIGLPILDNDQNIERLTDALNQRFNPLPNIPSFVIAGHGTYAWGSSVAEAKRHLFASEFLMLCLFQSLQIN